MNKPFDLNLIRVFCTIYETESLTATAEKLDITQPAISYALKKLRAHYDDPLFVRSEGRMIPTPLANTLAPNLKKSIELINTSLNANTVFKPSDSKKVFIISMSDVAQMFFIPPLCLILEESIGRINVEIAQVPQDKIEQMMRVGELDFALGNLTTLSEEPNRIVVDNLFEDRYVCMVRDGHPLSSDSRDTIDFDALKLVSVKNRITGHTSQIESINAIFSKNIALTIPNFSVAPEIVSKTDFGVIIPISIAKRYNAEQQFKLYEIEMPGNKIEINIYYHKLYENDPSIVWMRNLIIDNFRSA